MEDLPLDRPVRVIGRYALYGKLAAGGMATVHFGRLLGPAGFSRTVAIKRLHPQFAKDPEFVAMFLDEARLAARIQHPNVVATVDVVATAEELFLVMDYIRGESFSRLLRASRKRGIEVSLGTITSVIAGMLHGLHAAHEAKDEHGRPLSVVHRDVSPQNVLVGVDGVARVLDFGVAKAAARAQVTRDGQMKGKLSYMAPEQIQSRGVDRRTDVFAAGIVLWEALTGRRLFDAEEASEVLRMILSEEIPPPSAVFPSITRSVDAIVMKALARDPAARYVSAREFAIALEDATQIASPREVGEWVERVAGDTLLNREQTVAEIEAVSEASILTETSPGFLKTLKDQLPEGASAASEWDDGPTSVFDPASSLPRPMDDATRVHVPRPAPSPKQSRPPSSRGSGARPPPLPARSGRTQLGLSPPVSRSSPPRPGPKSGPPSGSPPRGAGPSGSPPPSHRHKEERTPPSAPPTLASLGFDDENETTSVFDPNKHGAEADDRPASVVDPNEHGLDDETETTTVFDSNASSPDATPGPTLPGKKRAPGPEDTNPRAIRPAAGAGAGEVPAATIIVQEHTDPSMFRPPGAAWLLPFDWLWADPARRVRRVGALALFVGVFSAAVVIAAGGRGRPPRHAVANAPRALSRIEPEPARSTAELDTLPRGIDPSTLPLEPGEGQPPTSSPPTDHGQANWDSPAKPGPAPRTEVAPFGKKPSPAASSLAPVVASPASPAVAPAPEDDENPYAPSAATKTSKPAPAKPAPEAKRPEPAPSRPAAGVAAACQQPYTIDETGIRRIKPECL